MVFEKTLESPLDCKGVKPINPEVLGAKVAYKPMGHMVFTQKVKASGEEKSKA